MGDNTFLWFWLAILGLGLLGMAYKGWEWRRIRAGHARPGQHEVAWRNLICSTMLAGVMGLLRELTDYLQAHLSFAAFMTFCASGLAVLFAIAAVVDLRKGRAGH